MDVPTRTMISYHSHASIKCKRLLHPREAEQSKTHMPPRRKKTEVSKKTRYFMEIIEVICKTGNFPCERFWQNKLMTSDDIFNFPTHLITFDDPVIPCWPLVMTFWWYSWPLMKTLWWPWWPWLRSCNDLCYDWWPPCDSPWWQHRHPLWWHLQQWGMTRMTRWRQEHQDP